MDQRAGQARGLAQAHYCTKTRRSRQKVRFGLTGYYAASSDAQGQGLVTRGCDRQVKNRGFGINEDLDDKWRRDF
jgi:hypothetical protein